MEKINRRKFMASAAVATSFIMVPRHVLGGKGFTAPSDKVNIGLVGAGGRGRENVRDLFNLDDVQVTCIADPAEYWDLNRFYYKTAAGLGPVTEMVENHYKGKSGNHKVNSYSDFREMLEKEKSLDAILCATPDHVHAYVSVLSMLAGKHVYCEKPLTHNIFEARQVQKIAKKTGLATQMGNQLHSTPTIRNAVEYLRSGVIGEVREVHSWVPATRWTNSLNGVPKTESPMPKGLNWDLWIGPKAYRPFHEVYAPVTWRDFWEFGLGALGDFGCHDLDAATWGLELGLPTNIQVHPAGFSNADIIPYGEIGYFSFPGKKENESIEVTWYSGGLYPKKPSMIPSDFSFARRGAMYIGENGIMVTGNGAIPKLFPASNFLNPVETTFKLPPTAGHHRDWINAIKGGPAASSHFEYGAHLTEITLLGVLSLRLGGALIQWDAENMKAKGLSMADMYIKEAERKGWELPSG
jgi:predicted dehydrogenase